MSIQETGQPLWFVSEWLGIIADYDGIAYHMEHGWLDWPGELATELYFYDYSLELWGWISDEAYPWIYWFAPVDSWTFYSAGGHPGDRWFFHALADEWRHEDNLKDSYTPPLEGMVYVPPGDFEMGDHSGDGNADELPVHMVHLYEYYIQRTEVTISQWDAVVEWGQSHHYDLEFHYSPKPGESNYPANGLTWYECVKFCNAKSEMEDLTPVYTVGGEIYRSGEMDPEIDYSVNGYRLPSEAEWEMAARGGLVGKRFPWGDTIDHDNAVFLANSSLYDYDTSGYQEDTFHPDWGDWVGPVGSSMANGYGLYDMAGNVYEFCNDYYAEDFYFTSPMINPEGPDSGARRVFRGGSYLQRAISSRVSSRGGTNPDYVDWQFGFRLAQSVEN